MTIKLLSVTMSTLSIISVLLFTVIIFDFSSFMEGYTNGFTTMQTTLQTISAYVGNITYYIIH